MNWKAWAARLALVSAALAGLAAHAQGVRETGRTHQDWTEACEALPGGGEQCFIFQRLKASGRAAANITLGYKARSVGPVAVVNMPLGATLLPDGLRFETDKGVDGWAPFRFCDTGGCHVETEIEPKLLAAMRAGKTGWLIVRDLRGKEVRLEFSLLGLTAGLKALKR